MCAMDLSILPVFEAFPSRYHQVDRLEYMLLWLTFVLVCVLAGKSAFGLIEGMTLGCAAAGDWVGGVLKRALQL